MKPAAEDLDFTRLLHQSQQLSAKVTGSNNIPIIFRGFEQIEAFSTNLATSTGALAMEARYGKILIYLCLIVYPSDLKNIEFSKIAFVPVGLEASVNALSTDVAGYLQNEYEKQIITSVERVQKEVKLKNTIIIILYYNNNRQTKKLKK